MNREIGNQLIGASEMASLITQTGLILKYVTVESVYAAPNVAKSFMTAAKSRVASRIARMPLLDSQLLAQRLMTEAETSRINQESRDKSQFGMTQKELKEHYFAELKESVAAQQAAKEQKDRERSRKEYEARADHLLNAYTAIVEPSPSLEYASFQDGVVGRQLGQVAFSGIGSEQ